MIRPLIGLLAAGLLAAACSVPAPQPPAASSSAEVGGLVSTPAATATSVAASSLSVSSIALGSPPVASLPPAPPAAPPPAPRPQPVLSQVTSNGCCVAPYFSADGHAVRFIDKPSPDAPTGVYQVAVDDASRAVTLSSPTVGWRNRDQTIVAVPEGRQVRFWNESTGQTWLVNTNNGNPSMSPDSQRVIWTNSEMNTSIPNDQRRTQYFVANIDGSGARQFASLVASSLLGWFPDNRSVLMTGRDGGVGQERTMFVLDLDTGERRDLLTQKGIRGAEISPDGRRIAFFASFADLPEQNGLHIVMADGSGRMKIDVPAFGAYRWRDGNSLAFIPIRREGESSMRVWSIDAASGALSPLTDPAATPFVIANGDWDISRDGRAIVFVSAADRNIYHLTLP